MLDTMERLRGVALQDLDEASTPAALDAWRVRYLGKKGEVTQLLRGLGQLPAEERRPAGEAANELKRVLEAAWESRQRQVEEDAIAREVDRDRIDITLPGRPAGLGGLHVTTQTLQEIVDIFGGMGFQVYESPEVEWDTFNFELLNMPADHPARDMWDTFYITDRMLLRTHTSSGQVRAMQELCPQPVRVLVVGKCYRYEPVTARSEFMFYQCEPLAVGEHITMADLKGTLMSFARQMFGAHRQVRFRCSYFPFTEPSVEMDIDCFLCEGKGCRMCKNTGWLEIMGAGMVHPTVLANGGYDPKRFSGFAAGMGPERMAILKYGIEDIRLFYSNDVRFLSQFD